METPVSRNFPAGSAFRRTSRLLPLPSKPNPTAASQPALRLKLKPGAACSAGAFTSLEGRIRRALGGCFTESPVAVIESSQKSSWLASFFSQNDTPSARCRHLLVIGGSGGQN